MNNKFSVYILECTSGLQPVYSSDNLNLSIEDKKTIEIDERSTSVEFAKKSEFYSIQISKNFKVYSIIDSKVNDSFGRGGYSVIHLISSNKFESIINFREVLSNLSKKYNEVKHSRSINSQSFEDELNLITTSKLPPVSAYFQGKKNLYSLFNDRTENQIDSLFNSPNIFIASKIYAFNENDILDRETGERLKLYELNTDSFRKYTINFDFGYLQSVQVGSSVLKNFGSSPITFYADKDEIPEVTIGSKNIKKQILKEETSFHKPIVPAKTKVQKDPNTLGPKNKFLLPIIAVGVVLTVILVFNFLRPEKEEQTNDEISEKTRDSKDSEITPSSAFIKIIAAESGREYYYTDDLSSINGFCFTEDDKINGTWYLYRSAELMQRNKSKETFSKESLENITVENREDWNTFADSLNEKTGAAFPKFEKKRTDTPTTNVTPQTEIKKGKAKKEEKTEEKTNEVGSGNKL